MDGVINVYKTKGMTSHDVVNRMRRIFNTKQVGHTGTLDPNAEGVLVICLNQATKLVQFLEADIKKYRAELIIGISTDTYDITGKVVSQIKDFEVDKNKLVEVFNTHIFITKDRTQHTVNELLYVLEHDSRFNGEDFNITIKTLGNEWWSICSLDAFVTVALRGVWFNDAEIEFEVEEADEEKYNCITIYERVGD